LTFLSASTGHFKRIKIVKPFKSILSCALAVGLVALTFAQANASVMIDNVVYSPLKIKLTFWIYNNKGAAKRIGINSKEILKLLGYAKDVQLAINTDVFNSDIVIINKSSELEDLTAEGILTEEVNDQLDSSNEGKKSRFIHKSAGLISLVFYSNPIRGFIPGAFPPVPNPNPDPVESEAASDFWFEISGFYFSIEKGSANTDGKQNISAILDATALSGIGYGRDLNTPNPTMLTGSASAYWQWQ
jgi:hypothetical protein